MWRIITLIVGNSGEIYLPLYNNLGNGNVVETDRWIRMEPGKVTPMTKPDVVALILEQKLTREPIYLLPNEQIRLSERLQANGCLLYASVSYVCAITDPSAEVIPTDSSLSR